MNHSLNLLITLFLSLGLYTTGFSYQKALKLKSDKTITKEISAGEVHSYTLSLKADEIAVVEIYQKGADAVITVQSPCGLHMGVFDSSNGTYGPEMVEVSGDIKGDYTIKVYTHLNFKGSGSYTIRIKEIVEKGETIEEKIDQYFLSINNSTPGVAVAVIKEGEVIYKKGHGLANLEQGTPIDESSIFHIASVSKQFTSFALLLLEEQGKLSLDDEIHEYIPELPDYGHPITLRQLASHTAGIKGDFFLYWMAGSPGPYIKKDILLNLLLAQKELNYKPGEEYSYSNGGYTLLAEVIEKVSGESYRDFLQAHIFQPLGMASTFVMTQGESTVSRRAYGYVTSTEGFKQFSANIELEGSTGIHSSLDDLIKWTQNLDEPKVGSRDLVSEMETEVMLNNGESSNYGLGQMIGDYKGFKLIDHGGSWSGYRAGITRIPELKLSVITLSNYEDKYDLRQPFPEKIIDLVLPQEQQEHPNNNDFELFEVEEEELKKYEGKYNLGGIIQINIKYEYGSLLFITSSRDRWQLLPDSIHHFFISENRIELEFKDPDNQTFNTLNLKFPNGEEANAKLVETQVDFKPSKQDYAGRYLSDELEMLINVENNNGKWMISSSSLYVDLMPKEEDVFTGNHNTYSKIEFERDPEGVITGLRVSTRNGRVRRQLFRKLE